MAAICGVPEKGHTAGTQSQGPARRCPPCLLSAQPHPTEAHGRDKEMNCHTKNPVRGTDLVS